MKALEKIITKMFLIPKKKIEENKEPLREELYLVTQAVDTSTIEEEQKDSDLEQLEKAEERVNYKSDIAKAVKDPLVSRAATSLQLKNPFKGI